MYLDTSKMMYKKKKKWFCGVKDMTIVTPSAWLADLVKQSFLKEYPVKVINNGIDLSVFKPKDSSDFRRKYRLENKKIILGVVGSWERRKGIDVFLELANRLSDDYRVVVVGTDNKRGAAVSDRAIFIPRTEDREELVRIYSAADVFVNPTREDTFPTVNIEALACGTPVLTFATGGSSEILDENCGSVVEVDDVDAMEREIIRVCEAAPYTKEACLERAHKFDMSDRFKDYVELYKEVINK
jgi:glycosyltransferase involved in cell wall biosynthesis